ncbi:MAG: carbon-nitrogen hydrolase family protein [Alphaproteobacteria bacterium]
MVESKHVVRAAVVQAASVVFDRDRTIEKARALIADAARGGAQLVVLPEAFVPGYPKGLDFGARVGNRTDSGREDFRRYWESAVEVPSPATVALGRAARDANAHLVAGIVERDGGTLYCTVVFFAPDGTLLGKHRKLRPTAAERLVWGFGDGSTLPVYDTALGKLGAVICWENYMPMLRMTMYAKGIQLYCAPTADGRDSWIPTVQHIALEGRCFVLSCCQYLTRADCPADYALDIEAPGGVLMRGGSCIVSPFGQILAGPLYGAEAILFADLDMAEIARGKYDMDVAGHYARPDIFRLMVNERPNPAVASNAGSVADAGDPFAPHSKT